MDFRQEVSAPCTSFHCLFLAGRTRWWRVMAVKLGAVVPGHHMSLGSGGGVPFNGLCLTASLHRATNGTGAVLINHLVALNKGKLGDLQVISCYGTTS